MIDNQLKKCCEKCNFDDLFTQRTEMEPGYCMDRDKDEFYPVTSRTVIGCKHMYVCKKYIEEKPSPILKESVTVPGFKGGEIPKLAKGGTLNC